MDKHLKSSVFCTRPFTSLYIGTDGYFQFCCVANSNTQERIPIKYHVTNSDIVNLWNSESYDSMRNRLLNNKKSETCRTCFSLNQESYEGLKKGARTVIDVTLGKDYKDYMQKMPLSTITFIELWFSNKCNLKCRMCNPWNSNQLIEGWDNLANLSPAFKTLNNIEKIKLTEKSWDEIEISWLNIYNLLKNIYNENFNQPITLVLSGGEPMLCEGMYKLFDLCISQNIADKITLRYNTNLTILPEKMIFYWKYFKKINIVASIDGVDTINNYIRYPSKYTKIISNVDKLLNLSDEINLSITIRPTLQVYNILSITTLYTLILQKYDNAKNKIIFMDKLSDPLIDPYIFNIRVLPIKLKDIAVTRLLNFLATYSQHTLLNDSIKSSAKFLIKYIYSKDESYFFPEFLRVTRYLDEIRNQNIFEIMPELKGLI